MKNNPATYKNFWKLTDRERNRKKIKQSEIRRDYLQERFVIISPKRQWKIAGAGAPVFEKRELACNLCPENINKEKARAVIKGKGGWQVKAVANKFPAFSNGNPFASGIQEIVVETPHHNHNSADFSLAEMEKVIKMYAERTKKLRKTAGVNYILIFKNSGKEAGASQAHAHSQIFGIKFIPPHILDKLEKEKNYKGCVYCDIIKKEQNGPRLVYKNKFFAVLCPYASAHSYEAMILPKRHIDNISALNADERKALAKIFKSMLAGIKNLNLSYNMYFHEVVKERGQHVYFRFKPRISIWAGLELGSGLIINPVPPEDAAEHYKSYF